VSDTLGEHEQKPRQQTSLLSHQARELVSKSSELQAASQDRSQFIAKMSHELRTPLNSILGFTALLLERSQTLSQDDRRALEEVRAAGRHLLTLVNDISDLARIGAGRLGLRRTSVPVGLIIHEVLEILRPQAQDKHLEMQGISGEDVMADADPSRLRQILLNLVGNAVKFTDQGSVTVRARLEGERVRIEVIDTGPGIAAADHSKLFREFSQLEVPGPRPEGSGLGLAIARELVLAHGGEISVESEVGRGSAFWFTLPAIRPQEPAASEDPSGRPAPGTAGEGPPLPPGALPCA
jgi:signal transduction histidine kinase